MPKVRIDQVKDITSTATEVNYTDGVTSAIQTQINAKSNTASPTFTGTVTTPALNVSGATASQLLATDASKNAVSLAVATYPSLTEVSYVKGVTSAIQTQLNAKGAGTVTSVAASVPSGLTISGSPVTTTGTLAIGLDTDRVIPTNTALAAKAPLVSPSFTTPSLGVATATSINGATITSGTLNGSVTGTNTGDQTSIVGITGTKAQFNTAVTDGDIVYTDAIGSTVQAYDADLTTWAGITPGANVGTALAVAVGSAGAVVTNGGALGTPSSGTLTNCTFPTLNQDTTGKSAKTDALNSATTVVNVSSATAPSSGQVLTATSSIAATWQTPTAPIPAYLQDATYPAGETLSAGNVVFIENASTTAQAVYNQYVSDIAANTRVSFPVFGSGTSASTLKLNLSKTGAPAAALGVRIETDSSGSPSGTLVNANATGTVAAASLSTSLADTTVTLGGAFTITAGQKCHVVIFQGTYGSETVNASNYYNIGQYNTHTTTRFSKQWGGAAWSSQATDLTETTGDTLTSTTASVSSRGYKIQAIKTCILKTVVKNASATPTRCRIFTASPVVLLGAAAFSGNTATFSSNITLLAGTQYFVECDVDGTATYTPYRDTSPGNLTRTNIQFITGADSQVNSATASNIESITTLEVGFDYTSSSLFQPRVLSKTDADFTYKIDWHGISQSAVTDGELTTGKYPNVLIDGIDSNQTGLTQGTTMYLSNTPGEIATTGTIPVSVGKAVSATSLLVGKNASVKYENLLYNGDTPVYSSFSTGTNSTAIMGYTLDTTTTKTFSGVFKVKGGGFSISSVQLVYEITAESSGNIAWRGSVNRVRAGSRLADGGNFETTAGVTNAGLGTYPLLSTQYDGIGTLNDGDILIVSFVRVGADAGDTYTQPIYCKEIIIT